MNDDIAPFPGTPLWAAITMRNLDEDRREELILAGVTAGKVVDIRPVLEGKRIAALLT